MGQALMVELFVFWIVHYILRFYEQVMYFYLSYEYSVITRLITILLWKELDSWCIAHCQTPRAVYAGGVQEAHLPIRDTIHIEVEVVYAEQHSRPGQHVFVYFITLENRGQETVQLLSREWFIHDGNGEVGHVQGEGVVGEKPILEPGQSYQYNSFCPIAHPPGSMQGYYTFQNTLGELFRVEIPAFALRLPHPSSRLLN